MVYEIIPYITGKYSSYNPLYTLTSQGFGSFLNSLDWVS